MNRNKVLLVIALVFVLCGIGWEIYKNNEEKAKEEQEAIRIILLKQKRENDSLMVIAETQKKYSYTYMDSLIYKLDEEINRFGSPKYNLYEFSELKNGIIPLEADNYKGYYKFRDNLGIFKSADIQIKYFKNLNVVVAYCKNVSDETIISEVEKELEYKKAVKEYNYHTTDTKPQEPELDFNKLHNCFNNEYRAFRIYEAFDEYHGNNIVAVFNKVIQVAEAKDDKYSLNIYKYEAQ